MAPETADQQPDFISCELRKALQENKGLLWDYMSPSFLNPFNNLFFGEVEP